jgi:hypothetical protein
MDEGTQTFRLGRTVRKMAGALAAFMGAVGLLFVGSMLTKEPIDWGQVIGGVALFFAGPLTLVVVAARVAGGSFTLDADGVSMTRKGQTRRLAWTEIRAVDLGGLQIDRGARGVVEAAAVKAVLSLASDRWVVRFVPESGEPLVVGAPDLYRFEQARDAIEEAAKSHLSGG